jgi:hypothetical protein
MASIVFQPQCRKYLPQRREVAEGLHLNLEFYAWSVHVAGTLRNPTVQQSFN